MPENVHGKDSFERVFLALLPAVAGIILASAADAGPPSGPASAVTPEAT